VRSSRPLWGTSQSRPARFAGIPQSDHSDRFSESRNLEDLRVVRRGQRPGGAGRERDYRAGNCGTRVVVVDGLAESRLPGCCSRSGRTRRFLSRSVIPTSPSGDGQSVRSRVAATGGWGDLRQGRGDDTRNTSPTFRTRATHLGTPFNRHIHPCGRVDPSQRRKVGYSPRPESARYRWIREQGDGRPASPPARDVRT